MSKQGIKKYVDAKLEIETPKKTKLWKPMLSIENCKMSSRNKGNFATGAINFRIDSEYPPEYKMQDLIKTMNTAEHLPKWDPQITDMEFKPLKRGDPTTGTKWMKH